MRLLAGRQAMVFIMPMVVVCVVMVMGLALIFTRFFPKSLLAVEGEEHQAE